MLDHLDGTLLSVWGSSEKDIWAVGGPRGNAGFGSLAVRFDGASWRRAPTTGDTTYWWVNGTGPGDVWLVGEKGRITHWDGASLKDLESGTTATLFGVVAFSPSDAWAVGGTPEGKTGAPNDVLLRWDGRSWSPVALPRTQGRTFFKVWGQSSEDLYVVGEVATVWHKKGSEWTLESEPPRAAGNLLTVFGCPGGGEVYAVGGRDVLRSDGKGAWTREGVTLFNDANGVSCGKAGEPVIVGLGGMKQRKASGAWTEDVGSQPFSDLHAAWVDPTGAIWAAGGNFLTGPAPNVRRDGVLARFGKGAVSSKLE